MNSGNRTGTTEVYGTYAGAVSTLTYDAKDRLTQDATSAPLAHTYTYTYDSRDNILTNSESGAVVQMNYDAASRLTTSTAGGVTTTYTFDSNGNLTGVNAAGTLTTMVYDKENRLKEHKQGAAANTRTFTYDLNSLKQSETVSKVTNQLVWDGADMMGEVSAAQPVGAPTMSIRYNLVQGILFATTRFEPAATRTDAGADFIGSILIDFDENGDFIAERRYKSYGELLAGTATPYGWTGNTGSRATLLQYSEQYNRRRHYSSKLKQWTTRDPLWPREHVYGYVNAGPLTWADPSGTAKIPHGDFKLKPWPVYYDGVRQFRIPPRTYRFFSTKSWVYGNWCGLARPGRSVTGLLPIDDLDNCCRCHDLDQGKCECGGYTGRAHHNLVQCAMGANCLTSKYPKLCFSALKELIALFTTVVIPGCVRSNGLPLIDKCHGKKPPCSPISPPSDCPPPW